MKPKIVTAQVLSNRINNCDDRPGVVAESRLEIKIENNNGFRVCYYLALFLKWKWDSVVEILWHMPNNGFSDISVDADSSRLAPQTCSYNYHNWPRYFEEWHVSLNGDNMWTLTSVESHTGNTSFYQPSGVRAQPPLFLALYYALCTLLCFWTKSVTPLNLQSHHSLLLVSNIFLICEFPFWKSSGGRVDTFQTFWRKDKVQGENFGQCQMVVWLSDCQKMAEAEVKLLVGPWF